MNPGPTSNQKGTGNDHHRDHRQRPRGQNIAKAAIANGYDVVLSNSQGPVRWPGWSKSWADASAATPAEAAARGDFAVVAIPITPSTRCPWNPSRARWSSHHQLFPGAAGHIPEIDNGSTTAPGPVTSTLAEKPGRAGL